MSIVPKIQLRSYVDGINERSGSSIVDADIALLAYNDCDVYKPNGEPLLLLRRGVIPNELGERSVPVLRHIVQTYGSDNRGEYAGLPSYATNGSKKQTNTG